MGEATHLSHSERVQLIQSARKVLDDAALTHVPIIAGAGAGSTRESVELAKEAASAGADYAIVIASGYFAGVLAGNKAALKAFFLEVAEKSPIPVLIYNCAFLPLLPIPSFNYFPIKILGHLEALISTQISSRSSLRKAPTSAG